MPVQFRVPDFSDWYALQAVGNRYANQPDGDRGDEKPCAVPDITEDAEDAYVEGEDGELNEAARNEPQNLDGEEQFAAILKGLYGYDLEMLSQAAIRCCAVLALTFGQAENQWLSQRDYLQIPTVIASATAMGLRRGVSKLCRYPFFQSCLHSPVRLTQANHRCPIWRSP